MTMSIPLAYIASIPKNQREEVRVTLEKYKGYHLISQRVWFEHHTGQMRPGKQGVLVQLHCLPDLIEALQVAKDHAAELGLLEL